MLEGFRYKPKDGTLAAGLNVVGISRHPVQLYEAISCVFLFAILYWICSRYKENYLLAVYLYFLIVCFGLCFLFKFLKEKSGDI